MKSLILFVASVLTLSSAWAMDSLPGAPWIRSVTVGNRALLANSFSQVLYVFDPDQGAGRPSCAGTCAEKWPPLMVTEDEARSLQMPFSTIRRDNDLLQVTFHGRPLYLFYLDRVPTEAKGDGLGGLWHVVEARE